MTVEIPFDKSLSKEQAWVMFNDIWRKNFRLNHKRIYYAVGLILAGSVILYGKNNIGLILIGFGFYFILKYIEYYDFYKRSKKTFNSKIEEILNKYEVDNNSVWEFNDDFLGYRDFFYDMKIKWEVIPSFKIIDDTIIIHVNQPNQLGYSISKKEVSSQTFDAIVHHLQSKIATQL